VKSFLVAALASSILFDGLAGADEGLATDLFADAPPIRIESVRARYTHYDQTGLGYQSQAGPTMGPGLENATVEQAQLEVVAKQGKLTHRLWVPLDVITAASPDAIDGDFRIGVDTVSQASRVNEAGSIELQTTYQADSRTAAFVRAGFHIEEMFRSWVVGAGFSRSFADDNAVFAASVNQVYDWFDTFLIDGERVGHGDRSTTNANIGLTQLLSPTTIAHVNYGVTLQLGELSNTYNSVPLVTGVRGAELLPHLRQRHALVARLAQWLPWNGAIHLFYRFYADDWGVLAHTVETELYQRLAPTVYVRLNYRVHVQRAVDFYTTLAPDDGSFRTGDSDLSAFVAQTVGAKLSIDFPSRGRLRDAHFDVAAERYFRSNGLRASIASCAVGFRF